MPAVEKLQSYVWRRHTLAVASRLLLAAERDDSDEHEPADGDEGTETMGVGFADIVNYTRQTRSLTRSRADRARRRVRGPGAGDHHRPRRTHHQDHRRRGAVRGRRARRARPIGLELVEEQLATRTSPSCASGLAWGPVLARLGDVLGPVVNVAARLTSTSRPGRVLTDRTLADALQDDERFKLRRMRRTSVKGYRRLEPWSLRRADSEDKDYPRAALSVLRRVRAGPPRPARPGGVATRTPVRSRGR